MVRRKTKRKKRYGKRKKQRQYTKKYKRKRRTNKRRRKKMYSTRRYTRKRGGNRDIYDAKWTETNDVAQLRTLLSSKNIPIDQWTGDGRAKTVEQLYKEIKNGESILKEINGKLQRQTESVAVQIFSGENKEYVLMEIAQYKPPAGERPTLPWVPTPGSDSGDEDIKKLEKVRYKVGMLEKIENKDKQCEGRLLYGCTPLDIRNSAVLRGIREELGEKYSRNFIHFKGFGKRDLEKNPITDLVARATYPGLTTAYKFYTDYGYIPQLTIDHPPSKGAFLLPEYNADKTIKRMVKWAWVKLTNDEVRELEKNPNWILKKAQTSPSFVGLTWKGE